MLSSCTVRSFVASRGRPFSQIISRPNPSRTAIAIPMALSKDDQVLELINRQLALYNAREVEPFMEVFADDVHVSNSITGDVMAKSKEELRPRYVERFKTPVHCELIGRLALGNVVVDREIITGLPDDGVAECMATYVVDTEAQPMVIKRVQFVWKPRTFGVKL